MSKGSIVLVPFPFTDLSGNKVRPALVLYVSKNGEDCVVAFISSIKQKTQTQFEIPIKSSNANGLKTDSIVRVDKIATLQKKIILGDFGKLELETLNIVDKKIKQLFLL